MATMTVVLPLIPTGDASNFLINAQAQMNDALKTYEDQGWAVLNVFQIFVGPARGVCLVLHK